MTPDKVKKRISPYLETITEACIFYPLLDTKGYGSIQYRVPGKKVHYRAHRVSFELANNCELLQADVILHSCDNPACINPRHLTKGTHEDNQRDKMAKGRQAKGKTNGRYVHGYYSKFEPVAKPVPDFQTLCNRSISLETAKAIKSRIKVGGCKLIDLSKEFGIPYQTIKDISAGRAYKNV